MSDLPPQRTVEDDDSEDDPDYIPPVGESDDSDSESRRTKKQKPNVVECEEDLAKKQEQRSKLWQDFQASVSTPPPKQPQEAKSVKIMKRYRFAGEDISKVIEVPEDSEDAKKWPIYDPNVDDQPRPSADSPHSPSPVPSSSGTPQPEFKARLGPRRPKKSLDDMFAAAKAKKLTTLGKSAMDWKEHVDSSTEIKEDLEANRRGGGYLEKVEFLQRVEQRKEAERELVGSKRRRH